MNSSTAQMGIRDEIVALKRDRTLSAAVELFYVHGYENTTLDAVAEKLGVTKPFIYSHFSSKAELLADICSRGIAASIEAMDSVIPLDLTPTQKLQELGRRFVTAVLENQKFIAIFTREEKHLAPEHYERINDMRRDFDRKLTTLLREGVNTGDFSLRDPHMAALSIGGMVSWAYVWFRPAGRLSVQAVAEEMTDLMLRMVGASESGTK
jgi:TetR/AcrR family transcriptional regulator, cholesterol catabolism regulator